MKIKKIVITIKKVQESAFKVRKAYGKPKTAYPRGGSGDKWRNDFEEV